MRNVTNTLSYWLESIENDNFGGLTSYLMILSPDFVIFIKF